MKWQVLIDKKFEGNIKNSKPHIRGVFCFKGENYTPPLPYNTKSSISVASKGA